MTENRRDGFSITTVQSIGLNAIEKRVEELRAAAVSYGISRGMDVSTQAEKDKVSELTDSIKADVTKLLAQRDEALAKLVEANEIIGGFAADFKGDYVMRDDKTLVAWPKAARDYLTRTTPTTEDNNG